MPTEPLLVVSQPIELLRSMVAADIARDGECSSTMVRAGLLAELLDELAALRQHALTARSRGIEAARVAEQRAVEAADMALDGLPEQARNRESMEAMATKLAAEIRALTDQVMEQPHDVSPDAGRTESDDAIRTAHVPAVGSPLPAREDVDG